MSEAPGLTALKNFMQSKGIACLGIIGDPRTHSYGYHLAPSLLPSTDYSLRGEANRPVGDHSCAIDIGMSGWDGRGWLRWFIERCRNDVYSGIYEVIGSYDGRSVRYWSDGTNWNTDGVPYTGSGHDTWVHVGIYRSTALQDRTNWIADFLGASVPTPQPPKPPAPSYPAWPGREFSYAPGRPQMHGGDVQTWQTRMAQRGWSIGVDGWYGPQSAGVARAFQQEKHLQVDGVVGPQTWAAAWTAPVT
ncbi:hypothetical protein Lfu02_54870 [Longispora fulva]|uniref:Peptidoglycan binding-like domain-containing protein n=1 Tax=Longispora fulva TaxID=619741 RepID=A0A8J7GGJ8_9ACTN|nr:peptidoglycan-binding domain-containing protein [Longispora fulva]MBG6137531.1 hypothetical protein [Longispora fulva]GIG61115.1 hypothetical protein Lfu02_54870 [Longispora fulva]